MRILLAVIVAASILGGIRIFLAQKPARATSTTPLVQPSAAGKFQIQLVPMFDAGPDAFAMDASHAPAIVVEMQGKTLLSQTGAAPNGLPVVIDDVQGLVVGSSELFVRATPADDDPQAIRAIRVRVLRDELVVAERWLSSEPGTPVEGTVTLQLAQLGNADNQPHP